MADHPRLVRRRILLRTLSASRSGRTVGTPVAIADAAIPIASRAIESLQPPASPPKKLLKRRRRTNSWPNREKCRPGLSLFSGRAIAFYLARHLLAGRPTRATGRRTGAIDFYLARHLLEPPTRAAHRKAARRAASDDAIKPQRYASQKVRLQDDVSRIAELDLDGAEEIKRRIPSFGHQAEVLEPRICGRNLARR